MHILPITDHEFGVLPPHFETDVSIEWEEFMPSYSNYPESFRTCLPFLLASLVFHKDWLRENLHPTHPLLSQRVFTSEYIRSLKSSVTTGYGIDNNFGMMATGIAHHILLAERIRSVESEINHGVKRKLEDVTVRLQERLEELPSKISDRIRSEFQIEGAVSLSRRDLDDAVATIRQEMRQFNVPREQPQSASPSTQPSEVFSHFCWGNRFHPVPANFQFPLMLDVKTISDLWWYGDASKRVRPYHFIRAFDLQRNADVSALSKAKKVLKELEEIERTAPDEKPVSQMTKHEGDQFFSRAFVKLMTALGRSQQVAVGELSYITVYDLIQRRRRAQA